MSDARKHHFISQCYLKGFTHNGSKKSQLYVISLDKQKTFETRPENVAHRRDFNRIEGLPPGALDHKLGQFEGVAEKAIQKISADRSLKDTDAWLHVLNLATLFAVRHPSRRENVREFIERTSKRLADVLVSTPQRFESEFRQAKADGFVKPDSEITYEDVRDFVRNGNYKVHVPNDRHIEIEFHVFVSVLQTMVDRQWTLCIAGQGCGHFVTSDHPVILVNTNGTLPSLLNPVGHGLTGTTLLFPLSRELFAIGTYEGPSGVRHLNAKGVANLNGIVLIHADREVYAPSGKASLEINGEPVPAAGVIDMLHKLHQGKQ